MKVIWKLAAAALMLASAPHVENAFAAETPIKLGAIVAFSGNASYYSNLALEGCRLAVKEIDAAGGVLGRPLELLVEDDQDQPELSTSKVRKLVDEGAVALIAASSSAATAQNQRAALQTRTTMNTFNFSDTLTTRFDNPYFFQIGALSGHQLKALLGFAKQRYHRAALVVDDTATGQAVAGPFRNGLKEAGIDIVAEQTIPTGATDVTPQLQRIRAADPDVVFIGSVAIGETALFFRSYRQFGLKYPILGSGNLGMPAYLELAPHALDGVNYVDLSDPDKPQVKEFVARFTREYGHAPVYMQAQAGCYDIIKLYADAITRAGSADREAIRDAMAKTRSFEGVLGAQGSKIGFAPGQRWGFPPDGVVIRVIEDNHFGPVVHAG